RMSAHSAALFLSAPEKTRANDVNYEYHQNPNFYYLTGHIQTNSALIITKEPITVGSIKTNEILFVEKRDPVREVWTGARLGTEGAKSVLRFQIAFEIDSFDSLLHIILGNIDTFYYAAIYPKK